MSEPAEQLGKLLTAVATMTDEVAGMKREVAELKKEVAATKDIVEAWQAVKVGGKFLKWVGGLATSAAATWLIMKALGAQLLK